MKFLQSNRDTSHAKNYFPGPGYYFTYPNDPKFNDFYKSSFFQNISNTENNVLNFGTAKRFNYINNNKTPGPGQYFKNVAENKQSNIKSLRALRNDGIHKKIKTIPSIPTSTQFYEELEDKNFLIKQEKDQKPSSFNEVGPGFYEPNFDMVKPKIPNARINAERKIPITNQVQSPADLVLSSTNYDNKNRPKSWQREFRKKNEEPSDAESQWSKNTFIHEKTKKKKKTLPEKDERGKSLFETHDFPLTDFYCGPEQLTCFKPAKKPKNLQFFESKVNRFQENSEKFPGPGDYNSDSYYNKYHKIPNYKSLCARFHQTKAKEIEEEGEEIIEKKQENAKIPNKIMFSQYPAVFGSGSKRFGSDDKVTPGPGDYNVGGANKKIPKKRTKVIVLEVNKQQDFLQIKENLPLYEAMDPKLKFDEEIANRQRNQSPNEEIKNFYNAKNTASFASKIARFQRKNDGEEKNLGPGSYEHTDSIVKPSFNTNKQSLFPQSEIRVLSTKKQPKSRLGPGSYDYDYTVIRKKL